jgi:asparagine N-glycosylation enzyme membrane subunit Stt3
MLKKNVGTVDKILRIVLGLALLAGALAGYGAWMWIGLIPLFTGLLGTCPLYTVFGFRTCPLDNK